MTLEENKMAYVAHILLKNHGNITQAAKEAGITTKSMYNLIYRYDLMDLVKSARKKVVIAEEIMTLTATDVEERCRQHNEKYRQSTDPWEPLNAEAPKS